MLKYDVLQNKPKNNNKQTKTTVIINVGIAILKKEFYERIIEIESIFNVFEVYLTKII